MTQLPQKGLLYASVARHKISIYKFLLTSFLTRYTSPAVVAWFVKALLLHSVEGYTLFEWWIESRSGNAVTINQCYTPIFSPNCQT